MKNMGIESKKVKPQQGGRLRKTPDEYRVLAKSRNFEWLGPEVATALENTMWQCDKGHIWPASYCGIRRGDNCRYCRDEKYSLSVNFYQKIAENNNLIWKGPKPKNSKKRTYWKCEFGHIFERSYNAMKLNPICPICVKCKTKKARKTQHARRQLKTEKDYYNLADERDFKWIDDDLPQNTHGNTLWQCEKGHQWLASFKNVRTGTGCPYCANLAPKTPEDYCILASKSGLKWLGPEVKYTSEKTKWKCVKCLAIWESSYNNILRGTRCSSCLNIINGCLVSKPQRQLAAMFNLELNKRVGPYVIDMFWELPVAKIAIEYDPWYWHAHRQDHDLKKDKYLIDNDWLVIRVKTNKKMPTADDMVDAITMLLRGESRVEIILDDWGKGPTRFPIPPNVSC